MVFGIVFCASRRSSVKRKSVIDKVIRISDNFVLM